MTTWNRYTKTIKGRAYHYLQQSYRDPATSKPRTRMQYLGPAGAAYTTTISGTVYTNPFLNQNVAPKPYKANKRQKKSAQSSVPKISNLSLVKQFGASTASLEQQWKTYHRQLHQLGLTLPTGATMSFQNGTRLDHQLNHDGSIIITLPDPHSGVSRNMVRAEVRKALTRQFLSQLATRKPSEYRNLVHRTSGTTSMVWNMAINHLAQSARSLSPAMLVATLASVVHGDNSKYLAIDLNKPTFIPKAAELAISNLMQKGVTTTKKEIDKDRRNNQRRLNAAIKSYYAMSPIKRRLSKGRKLKAKIKAETAKSLEISEQQTQHVRLAPY